jgi:hypothetical protein
MIPISRFRKECQRPSLEADVATRTWAIPPRGFSGSKPCRVRLSRELTYSSRGPSALCSSTWATIDPDARRCGRQPRSIAIFRFTQTQSDARSEDEPASRSPRFARVFDLGTTIGVEIRPRQALRQVSCGFVQAFGRGMAAWNGSLRRPFRRIKALSESPAPAREDGRGCFLGATRSRRFRPGHPHTYGLRRCHRGRGRGRPRSGGNGSVGPRAGHNPGTHGSRLLSYNRAPPRRVEEHGDPPRRPSSGGLRGGGATWEIQTAPSCPKSPSP